MSPVKLSIVIPAYKEERTIISTVNGIDAVLATLNVDYEIICVVDGRVDRTYENVSKIKNSHLRVLSYDKNLGKGHAVRFGMEQAKGEVVGFVDANGINPRSIPMLLQHFNWYKADIIVGSKRHPVSKVLYPWLRRILSWGYQMLIRVLFDLEIRDTQVGAKLFKKSVITKVLPLLLVKDFAFDIELLAVAKRKGFKNIYESPIELELSANKDTSTIFSKGFVRNVIRMMWDTLAVFYRLKIMHYYDK